MGVETTDRRHTKVGGRKKGTPKRATADIKQLAHKHGPEAIAELARLAKHALSEQARVTACRDLLDRAYGKASQALQSQVEVGASSEL